MRRKDREILENQAIDEVIQKCDCCRLGFMDDGEVYIVPLNFGYENISGKRIFYFHGANSGRKISLITKNPHVGFELDANYQLVTGETACNYSAYFQSVIGNGIMSFIENPSEKEHALQLLMKNFTGKDQWIFDENALSRTTVFKLEVEKLSCKEHQAPSV